MIHHVLEKQIRKYKMDDYLLTLNVWQYHNLIQILPDLLSILLNTFHNHQRIPAESSQDIPYEKVILMEKLFDFQQGHFMGELGSTKLKLTLRGKFVFDFMTTFIRTIIEDEADEKKRTILKKKVKYHMDNSSALTLLTTYAETPDCLIDFIKSYN